MPERAELASRTPEFVHKAMASGAMVPQSAGLSDDEMRAVAQYLTGKNFGGVVESTSGKCATGPKAFAFGPNDWNGWGGEIGNSRYQPKPGFTREDIPNLKLKWAFGFAGDTVAFAQPTVAGGRVFVGSAGGKVYSLDAQTGCSYWTYDAGTSVRNAVSIGKAGNRWLAMFGDTRGWAHAVDVQTGERVWKLQMDDHPVARITGSPTYYDGTLYVPVSSIEEASAMSPKYECCKFRGSVVAIDAAAGKMKWKSYVIADEPKPYKKSTTEAQLYGPAGGAIWSSPTLDPKRGLVYASTGNSYTDIETATTDSVVAFDMKTGKMAWFSQVTPKDNFTMACGPSGRANCPEDKGPDYDLGTSPILRNVAGGKQILVAAQKSGVVYGLDPDNKGKKLWETRVGLGGALGGVEWGHAADDLFVYAPVADRGRGPGGLHAVKISDGEKVWSAMTPKPDCKPGAPGCQTTMSAAATVMPGIVFAGGVDAHLRAYLSRNGEILWDYNAAQPYETVNGVKAKGGSFDAPGPTIANGMLFVSSGYGQWGGIAGNVLLVFSVNGK